MNASLVGGIEDACDGKGFGPPLELRSCNDALYQIAPSTVKQSFRMWGVGIGTSSFQEDGLAVRDLANHLYMLR